MSRPNYIDYSINQLCDCEKNIDREKFPERFEAIQKEDESFCMDNFVKESNRILMRSKSFNDGKDGYVSSARHEFIEKDALPGITLVAVTGFISPIFECEYGPIEILVQKNNTGDSIYWENGPVDDTRVYHFDIPDKLTKDILKHFKEDYEIPADDPIDVYYP